MLEFSESEIQEFLNKGMSYKDISERMNTTPASIRYWVNKHPSVKVYARRSEAPGYIEKVKEALYSSTSVLAALRKLGLSGGTGNYQTVASVCKKEGIDINTALRRNILNKTTSKTKDVKSEDMFTENSHASRKSIKKTIIREGMLPYVCSLCGLAPFWNKTELVLILDHINGIFNDNRLQNLRFCCPNCNSQLSTHTGKNTYKILKRSELLCGRCRNRFTPLVNGAMKTICTECASISLKISNTHRFSDKDIESILLRLSTGDSYCNIGRTYGISDNAVRKRMRLAGVTPPKKRNTSPGPTTGMFTS